MDKKPFHLYGTTPDAPDAPTPDCISPSLMNRLIAVAILVVAIVTFQEWHRQRAVEEAVSLKATIAGCRLEIQHLLGEGGFAESVVNKLKAEGGVVVGSQTVKQDAKPVEKPKSQTKPPTKPPKLNGQSDRDVYSGGSMPAADWR
jgi:hypothetical protein